MNRQHELSFVFCFLFFWVSGENQRKVYYMSLNPQRVLFLNFDDAGEGGFGKSPSPIIFRLLHCTIEEE